MKKQSLSALAAAGLLAGGLSVSSASAADLGGNCCADLEERIAELEATTARKGNRKVSLTISGWVAEQVMFHSCVCGRHVGSSEDGSDRSDRAAMPVPHSAAKQGRKRHEPLRFASRCR